MGAELLLDTGALVSLLDRRQILHDRCGKALSGWKGDVVSTEAVLTEASHLMRSQRGGRAACVEVFVSGAATLMPLTAAMLRRAHTLLQHYADLPMDFADATLVVLAEELGTDAVLTTD
ncbi:MAG: type II toxin-antitoxin system VapC family toxin, partial [Thermoanaerobaculia bacterium]